MYRRTLFLETLHSIREEMSREADYDVDLFAEFVRTGFKPERKKSKPAVTKTAPVKKKKVTAKVKTRS